MEKRILIIEDDQDILDMMTYILSDAEFDVFTSTKEVSPAYVAELAPAVILLDNRLAGGFGRDLCLKLKSDPTTQLFPVIIVSAANQLPEMAADSGADAYLTKPFDLDDLVAIVRKFA